MKSPLYDETIKYLFGLQWHGIKLGLDNPREILRRLENPQNSIPSLAHIAGTNGKGSTAAMLCSLLRQSGRKTGLFTSPHLVSFTERISVNRVEITEDEVVELARRVISASECMTPTFFEVVTAMGFLHFSLRGAECAVIETGMGGRLDATNVISPKVVIITPIGLDHADFLGGSIDEIASEKAGIIKPGVPVVCAAQRPEAMAVIEARATELGAPLYVEDHEFNATNIGRDCDGVCFDYGELKGLRAPLRGEYQARNAALALKAFELMTGQLEESVVREALGSVRWPGRLEQVAENPPVYVDGAHNPAAAAALAGELMAEGLEGGLTLVMGVMSDKDAEGIMRPLLPLSREAVFTRAAYGRAAPVESLIKKARELAFSGGIRQAESVREAIAIARALGRPVLVAGSFYTAGEALEALGRRRVLGTLGESPADSSSPPSATPPNARAGLGGRAR